jgi:hypothetical protein
MATCYTLTQTGSVTTTASVSRSCTLTSDVMMGWSYTDTTTSGQEIALTEAEYVTQGTPGQPGSYSNGVNLSFRRIASSGSTTVTVQIFCCVGAVS